MDNTTSLIVYDYMDEEGSLYIIPEYVTRYLLRFGILDLYDLDFAGESLDYKKYFYKPTYIYNGRKLNITHDDKDGLERTYYLKYGKYPIAELGPYVIKIKRKEPGLDIPKEWTIETYMDMNSVSVKCSTFKGLSFEIIIIIDDKEKRKISINACCKDKRGTHNVSIEQSLDDQFFKPKNYLDYLAKRIVFVRYDKNDPNASFENLLIHEIVHDIRIVNALESMMHGKLLECDNIEKESHVSIVSEYVKK